MNSEEGATQRREVLRCVGTRDVTEVSSLTVVPTAATNWLPSLLFLSFPSSYVIESVWLKLNNIQAAVVVMKQSNCTSFLSPSLSLLLIHFSVVSAQGSWSRAMLSQQQRDADGRAAQSGINVHCRALRTWGREGKKSTSQREGGVWLIMRNHVLFHLLENWREWGRKMSGDRHEEKEKSL